MSGRREFRPLLVAGLTAVLLATFAVPALSQRRGPRQAAPRRAASIPDETGRGYFQVGYMGLDLGPLNQSLLDAGYPTLDDSFLTLGGGGYGGVGRFVIGGEGHGLIGRHETTSDGTRRISAGGGYGLFRVGYRAFSWEGLDIVPLIGVGGGGLSLDILERSVPIFDDVLADPGRSSRLSTGMFLLDASVAASYRVQMPGQRRRERERGGLLLGLQVGYTFAPGRTSWKLDGINDVAGGPDFEIEGASIRLSIGGWGREEPDDDGSRRPRSRRR